MTRTPPVRADLAKLTLDCWGQQRDTAGLAFLADQALTEALITAQMRAVDDQIDDTGSILQLLNDCDFAVIIRPMYPGNGAHNITLRHVGGAELDAAGPDVDQLLWGFLGVETVLDDAVAQPVDSDAP